MKGVIDTRNNPFAKDSWVEQGLSFTQDRQELAHKHFKKSVKQIKDLKDENFCNYPAFLAIRWGFAFLRHDVLYPSFKWNHREYYDGFGEPILGFIISEPVTTWEDDFNVKIFRAYETAGHLGYHASYFLRKIRKDGGIKSAKHWLNPRYNKETEGFIQLKEMGNLNISLEALVLRYPYHNLFLKEELDVARSRLIKAGYKGPELEA